MTLRTKAKCVKVYGKSTSPAFKNIKEGDVISFSVVIEWTGYPSRYIQCINERTKEESYLSFNQIVHTLNKFKLEELQ